MKVFTRFLCFALSAVLLTGCTAHPPVQTPPATQSPATDTAPMQTSSPTEPTVSALEQRLQTMTLRQKVGQLFLVFPDALELPQLQAGTPDMTPENLSAMTQSITEILQLYPVGGIVASGSHIHTPQQITTYNHLLQQCSPIPLFLALDEEGGSVARVANNPAFDVPKYSSAAAVGAENDPNAALAMGSTIGAYLKEYGFNMDFAPVADVNTNPNNPVIGKRAFSSDGAAAATLARAMADGLLQQGIIPVFKHFPGHGDTAEDSHLGIAVVKKDTQALKDCEWLPFQQATDGDCIMVGHIALPEIFGNLTPATLSREIVTGILREQLGFGGLIITDSLSMGAITGSYSSGEAAVKALEAGCDLLLLPQDFRQAFDQVLAAVEEGRISEDRLDASIERILQYKSQHLGYLP